MSSILLTEENISQIPISSPQREALNLSIAAELRANFDYDFEKFWQWSGVVKNDTSPVVLAAKLTGAYHSLEKGLTLEEPRALFGRSKVKFIIRAVRALEKIGYTSVATRGGRGTIQDYMRFHKEHHYSLPADYEKELRDFVSERDGLFPGGAVLLTKKEVQNATAFDYTRFVQTRHSIRHYTGESVSPEQIKLAVSRAIHTPRAVNRETRRVYVAYDTVLRNHVLKYQHGNIGFGHKLGAVLIITTDIREFDIIGERNQAWIDGGLFAMGLNFALHADNLGTCMLNWSADKEQDQALRSAFEIPEYEVIITMLGVGSLPESLRVAASPAPVADDILSVIKPRFGLEAMPPAGRR
ncbi:nitroreductase family protein [Aspergillus saccharolyticus JOP 1030-1]|uniref:Nitroreductase n=1 Tax=Aspergillus saccharolyticus JOP 1030-1 TaxID=1450539 RepID=A0A319AQ67_9EURO|nr:Nitroreductase [Aspergillus saccharolyticus JOP 1030-1]PYH48552.1 Nitroreductase [Aspergillus saccharolyticus JOP 1030-1]